MAAMEVSDSGRALVIASTVCAKSLQHVPEDVLYEIFSLVAFHPQANEPRPLSRAAMKKGSSWMAITYVCRCWRQVALQSARLWSCIILNEDCSPTMLRAFLQRSGRADLSVIIEKGRGRPDSIDTLRYMVGMCAVCTSRLGSLYISRFTPCETNIILSPFVHPAVRLTALVISAEYCFTTPFGTRLIPVFRDEMPILRSIVVSQLWFPWRRFRGITQLLLINQPAPSFADLVVTLRACPALRCLGLGFVHSVYPPGPPGVRFDGSMICLPALGDMLLIGHHDVVAPLLRLLDYPPSATTVVAFHHSPRVRVLASNNVVAHVRHAVLDVYDRDGHYCVKISSTTDSTVHVQWEWRDGVDRFDDDTRMEHFDDLVRFSGVEHLVVRTLGYALYEEDWLYILRQMSALRHLELKCCLLGNTPVFRVLSRLTTDIWDQETFVLCPTLASFTLSGVHDHSQFALEQMVSWLERRRDHRARLSTVRVDLWRSAEEYPAHVVERLRDESLADTVELGWEVRAASDHSFTVDGIVAVGVSVNRTVHIIV